MGKLPSELSAAACSQYLKEAEQLDVKKKMKACVNAVSNSIDDDEQRAQMQTCKSGSVASSLAAMTGRNVSEVSSEEMQDYLQTTSQRGVSTAMSACMASIDTTLDETKQTTARAACSESAIKNALTECLGLLFSDISDETVDQYLTLGAQYASRKTARACMQVCACITKSTHTL